VSRSAQAQAWNGGNIAGKWFRDREIVAKEQRVLAESLLSALPVLLVSAIHSMRGRQDRSSDHT
jgi:hypothetical protein